MSINETLQQRIRNWRESGMTNQEIADKASISHSHANRLLNGSSENIGSLKFNTVLTLFPDIQEAIAKHLNLPNATNVNDAGTATATDGSAASINGDATVNNAPLPPDFGEIMPEIMASDMCDACKVKAFNIVAKFK